MERSAQAISEAPAKRRPGRRWVRLAILSAAGLLLLLVLSAAAYLAAGYVIYDELSAVSPGGGVHASNTPGSFAVRREGWEDFDTSPYLLPECETVRFASRRAAPGNPTEGSRGYAAGVEIAGWYRRAPGSFSKPARRGAEKEKGAPAVVLVHGLGASRRSHEVLIPAGMLWRAGFSVLLIDLREHGESEVVDGRTALGNDEYLDVLGAWDWLVGERRADPERIGLFGTSLGAATVIIALGREPRARAAFVDSPFSDLRMVANEELKRNGYPTFLLWAGTFMARVASGDDLLAHSPQKGIREMAKLGDRALFLTHGLADTRLGAHHGRRLVSVAEAEGLKVGSWFVPEADHLEAMLRCPDEYRRRLVAFFREALAK